MNVTEARAIVNKLLKYKGITMVPFLAVVKDFMIVPRGQKAFDSMFKDITDNQISLEQALQPHENDVTILVYFDTDISKEGPPYCSYDYFLANYNIRLEPF